MKSIEKQSATLKQKINDFKDDLTDCIDGCNQVFLISHKNPDFDAIASLGAMALVCKKLKKAPYIIIDEDIKTLPYEVASMVDKIKEKFIVINTNDYKNNKTDNDLLIMTDVNKDYMTSLENDYKNFKDIVIVDHHIEDKSTVLSRHKLITEQVSSTSELLSFLINQYKISVRDNSYYTYLLSGIYLDTNNCNKNVFPSTYEAIKYLIEVGADQNKVEELLSIDFESDRRVQNLIDTAHWVNLKFMIATDGNTEYTKEEVAQASDYMMKFGCDATFAIGKDKDGSYNICARSKDGSYGIVEVMNILNGGGGNECSASCPAIKFNDEEIDDKTKSEFIRDKIIKIIL